MPQRDKVLTVERVIDSLGLETIRNSMVGTVEKRGISGGQRKRVNVGIEMVMKPSLLILDEPTSGLDSSSSQLLLKALRREALEGTNICAVIHQPRLPTKNHFGRDNSEVSQYNDSFCSAAIRCTVCLMI
jgi:ABC-type multidrug transport system ATPase subunit